MSESGSLSYIGCDRSDYAHAKLSRVVVAVVKDEDPILVISHHGMLLSTVQIRRGSPKACLKCEFSLFILTASLLISAQVLPGIYLSYKKLLVRSTLWAN